MHRLLAHRPLRAYLLGITLLSLLVTAHQSTHALGTWLPAGPLAAPRASHGAFLLADGRVFVAGDVNPGGGAPNLTTTFFDPASRLSATHRRAMP